MIRYFITDSQQLAGGLQELKRVIARALEEGIEWIQIREKHLAGRQLYELVSAIMQLPNPHGTKILVNTRVDIALACRTHGAHLPSGSIPPSEFRRIVPEGFLIGVSCHSISEAMQAEAEGADFVVLGPIFEPRSKQAARPPLGLETLRGAARTLSIPVLALGGISEEKIKACMEAGAAGIAAITYFQTQLA